MSERTWTLFELNALVGKVIETTLNRDYWVEAELSECRESRGHCYMELVQKDAFSNTPVARAQAKCWRSAWTMIAPYFERATGQQLHAGLKVRMKVYPQFHEAYGFSWIVTDIDPTFTLGDMARRRQEIIRQLRQEGVFDLQKELQLPLFCLRIAVISSATAAGYGDFVRQLADSPFAFQPQLFTATMQGEQVEQSIIAALDDIYRQQGANASFDCVVIIRGGGATADLSGFDTLALAENVAQFPLPIITGIGHDRDESILDMVSHTRVKTPTAAAQLLVSHAEAVMHRIENCQERIVYCAQSHLQTLHSRLDSVAERIPTLFSLVRTRQEARLERLSQLMAAAMQRHIARHDTRITLLASQLPPLAARFVTAQHHRLDLLQQRAQALDPALLLRRGYSITLKDGKALHSARQLKAGDEIETRLEKGTIKSIVK